jgi:hypothetical protein
MYINNDELDLMIKIENLVGCNLSLLFPDDEPFKMKEYDGTYTIITRDDFNDYWDLIERLINKKKKRNERQAKITRERRKIDPLYARSKKEKERILNKTIDKI